MSTLRVPELRLLSDTRREGRWAYHYEQDDVESICSGYQQVLHMQA